MRDIVAYARERHIEVLPEIDMPGHFVAAMTAYPEFSCTPDSLHQNWIPGAFRPTYSTWPTPRPYSLPKTYWAN